MKIRFKLKRWHKIAGIIILFFALLLFFLSTIVRIWLVRNSEDIIGRKIELEELHFNYLRCSVSAGKFVMYESNKTDTFVSFDNLYINFAPWHLLRNEYAFTEITLKKPDISIINSEKGFNFDDLFRSSDTTKKEESPEESPDTVRFLVRNLNIIDGNIHYTDKTSDNRTEIKKLNISVPEIAWNNNNSQLGINFILGESGKVTLGGSVNQKAGKYSITAKTENIDIAPFAGYLKPYIAASEVKGLFYSDVSLKGELDNPLNIKIFGDIGIRKLEITDSQQKPFCLIDNVYVRADSLDLAGSRYDFRAITLTNPLFYTTLEKTGTNIDRLLAPYFADTTGSESVTTGAADTTQLHYSIDSLMIEGGKLAFADLTLNRPFSFNVSGINVSMTDFSDTGTKIPLKFSMLLNGSGNLSGTYTLDMVNSGNILFDGNISNLSMISLAPYSEYYLARPVTKGTFNYTCRIAMTPTSLSNQNHVKIVNLEFGRKTKDTTAYRAPIPLALYIIKDRNGIIEFDLPVNGNPSSPTFKLGKLIWKTLEEFLLKSVTAPFNALGRLVGADPGTVKEIPFEFAQDSLTDGQRARLDKIAEIIQKKPELSFSFIQTTDPEKEMNLIAVREAKKIFVTGRIQANASPETIKHLADNTSETDREFLTFLGMPEGGPDKQFYDACKQKTGAEVIKGIFDALLAKRESQLKSYLAGKGINNLRFTVIDFANQPEEMKTPKFVVDITLN